MVAYWNIPGRGSGPWTVHVRLDMSGWIHSGRCDRYQGKSHAGSEENPELLGPTKVRPRFLGLHPKRFIVTRFVLWVGKRVQDRFGRFCTWTLCSYHA